ncbi:hypothetical protein ACHAW5_006713 [Stephanodiscus triporus]|uniref:Gfo/Idh/MocA-like oxidoreductase N-terminal domain-containing protein n=1 Tax=Stephanodiscus triporus TaxID=2934178 RepID=A0ABD3N1U2_9STRA
MAAAPDHDEGGDTAVANLVLIGAGWWGQGWHLPHMHRNERVNISAIVDSNPHPESNLNPNLESLDTLSSRYGCPNYRSLTDLLRDPNVGPNVDGAVVCTPHSTHFEIGRELIAEGRRRYEEAIVARGGRRENDDDEDDDSLRFRPVNVLMEKPMTTDVDEARALHELLMDRRRAGGGSDAGTTIGGGVGCFLVNHSANYRPQARAARSIVESGGIGTIRHVTAFLASPLSWIFDDPSNTGWNEPDRRSSGMIGNGFAWGQSSHVLAWVYHAVGPGRLVPSRVHCVMTHSDATGADVSHAATVTCECGAAISLSGTSLLPGNAHSDPPVPKEVVIHIFGTRGALSYCGNDRDPSSGRLEWSSRHDDDCEDEKENGSCGAVEVQCSQLGFQFEELDQDGIGPSSMQYFIDACLGHDDYHVGADCLVGLRCVQTIDAMYRSNASGNCENVKV